jgi:ubiquinone/menaquinone biosynthesis C-methylase UbiE
MFSDPEKNIGQFSLGKGDHVADFGAGAGFYSFAAAEAVSSDGKVYSIDVQKDLLQRLKKEANIRHLTNIEILWADIEHYGGTKLRESSMDAVIAANVLFQIKEKNKTCLEINRILKKGGRVLLVDWSSSFGGMGPQQEDVFLPEKAKEIFTQNGFEFEREISAGAQHFGLIFRKK